MKLGISSEINSGSISLTVLYLTVSILFLLVGCTEEAPKTEQGEGKQTSGFQRMNDSINSIVQDAALHLNTYENDYRYQYFIDQYQKSNQTDHELLFKAAIEALNAGNTEKAIELMEHLQSKLGILKEINEGTLMFHKFMAICFMRMGEQNNCIHNHTDQSCIVPIKEKGIHLDKTGSERAIDKYLEILAIFPEDYESRWLLNLAYMTLDQYPQKVPREYLIPIAKTSSQSKLENIATRTGLDHFGLSGGVIIDDFNNDNLLDLLISSWGFEGEINFYVNNGQEGFKEMTAASGLDLAKGGLNLKQADYNNDGHLDFFVLRGAWKPQKNWGIPSNSLIKNNGDGTFSDATFEAGMYSQRPSQSAEWFDYNNDGWLDLFVANETTNSSDTPFPCELFRNNGDGTFTDVANEMDLDFVGYFKGVVAGDINNDGWQDLYISNLAGDNILLLNEASKGQERSFRNIADQAGVQKPFSSFPAWFFDYDNDGWLDIFAAAYGPVAFSDQAGQFARELLGDSLQGQASMLYKNNGNLSFTAAQTNYFEGKALSTMGCNFGDFNADGFPDFYLGTGAPDYRAIVPNRFFTNISGQRFEEQTFELGVGHIQKGHGISFADLNNDGGLDIYAVMGGAFKGDKFPNALFRNNGHGNNWLKLKLEGVSSNRSAIGARVQITGTTYDGVERKLFHQVSSGASFGANPLLLYIGLGKITSITKVEIMWPNGSSDYLTYHDIKPNKQYFIQEGKDALELNLEAWEYKFMQSKSHDHAHHH